MKFKKQRERINELKPVLIDAFVDYYGEEYRERIQERINNVKFFFDTNPIVAKSNVERCPSKYSVWEKMIINEEYIKYKKLKKDIEVFFTNKIIDEIYPHVKKVVSSKETLKEKLYLLSRDFSVSCVDAFSSKSLGILKDEKESKVVKESIKRDQNKFLEKFGVDAKFVSPEKVDRFISFRDKIREVYLNEVAIKSNYGKKLKKFIEDEIDDEIEDSYIRTEFYNTNLCAFSWSREEGGDISSGCIIRAPLFDMRLDSKAYADLCFIHELVHNVETVVDVGILDGEENNRMANEIRTQMVAKQIARKLQDRGVTIFCNSLDKPIKNEHCLYENMFPLVWGIFDKYEKFISKCAIEGTPKVLEKRFGIEWKIFSKKLDQIYDDFGRWDTVYCDDIEDGELLVKLKAKMDYNYKKSEMNLNNR